MQTLVIVIHLMLVTALIGVVLLQKSEGGGLGMGGGGGGGFMSSRGTANVLTRATAFLGAAFFATSLVLSILAGWNRAPRSILTPGAAPPASQTAPGPGVPQTPLGQPGGGGVLDQLRQPEAPPAGPQAPQSR
jgi:preprotein translocase subunit SecG